jgi:hypothetical protein
MLSPYHDQGPLPPRDSGPPDPWGIAGLVIFVGSLCAAMVLVCLKY